VKLNNNAIHLLATPATRIGLEMNENKTVLFAVWCLRVYKQTSAYRPHENSSHACHVICLCFLHRNARRGR